MAAPQTPPTKSPLAQPVRVAEAALGLQRPVAVLWGVGGERAKQLARLDIHTVEDLLLHRPSRYEDRRNFRAIKELQMGEAATVRIKIIAPASSAGARERALFSAYRRRHGASVLPLVSAAVDGGALHHRARISRVRQTQSLRPRTIDHPETELVEEGERVSFTSIASCDLSAHRRTPQRWLRGLIWRTLEAYQKPGSGVR
jgi:ATP-dependent DNA helicase RecG